MPRVSAAKTAQEPYQAPSALERYLHGCGLDAQTAQAAPKRQGDR